MFRSFAVCLAVVVAVQASPVVLGQGRASSLIAHVQASRYGLERSWFAHVEVDPKRGSIAHLLQHVNSTDGYSVFEVHYDGGRRVFTERDLDRLGVPLGKEGAQKLAQREVSDLNLAQRNARLTSQVIPEITLYAMTDRAVLHAIDAETGRTRWAELIGSARYPSEAPAANDKYVAALNGSNLSLLDQSNGKLIWLRKVRGAVGAGPAISERYVLVPMIDGTVEAYDIEEHRQPPWVFQSHGRAMTPPIYTGKYFAWTTDRGHLNVARGNENTILYRVETETSIAAEATVLPPDKLLVAAVDGYIYCIEADAAPWSGGSPVENRLFTRRLCWVKTCTRSPTMATCLPSAGIAVRRSGAPPVCGSSLPPAEIGCTAATRKMAWLSSRIPAAGCWEPYRLRDWISHSSTSRPTASSSAPAKA